MRFLVVGCGSIGRRHLANLMSLKAGELLAVDPDNVKRQEVESQFNIETFNTLEGGLNQMPEAVLICSPPSFHIEGALASATAGCHLFIEKPLSHTLDGIAELAREVEKRNLISLIGSNFKFHPSFVKMKEVLDSDILGRVLSARCQFGQYLPDWHPWEDYRLTYSGRSELGGGTLLDSHEFDYMGWFLGEVEEVFCMAGKLSDLEIDTEDTAEVILRFASGTIGEIHLDYTQRTYQRNYEFFGEKGTLKWDFGDSRLWLYKANKNMWEVFEEPRDYDLNDMYVEEMRHFIDCIQNGKMTVTDLHSGCKTLKAIMAAKASAKEGWTKRISEGH